VLDFLNRLFGQKPSSATAKERLRLVLLSDHLALAPDVVESLKHDLIEVISRYCEVDTANCDVTFERQDKQIAMLANIPILGMQKRPPEPPAAPAPNGSSPGRPATDAPALAKADGAAGAPEPPRPKTTSRRRRRKAAGVQATPRAQPT
jgi:cell division topological specificity factor